jgi:molecular chaperone HtpG
MIGVKREKSKLLDILKVRSYIEKVAPLPFDTLQFHFGKQIDTWLRREVADYQTYRIFLDDSLLKKNYSLTVPIHNKPPDELTAYEKIDIQDRQGKVIARGWLGVRKDNLGAILPTSGFESLRVRVGNILIGDASLLDPCFGTGTNARFNGYLVGEIHIITRELVPNGRRDDFQDSEMKTDFLRGVEKIVVPLITKSRKDSEYRNLVKPIETAKQTIIKVNKQLESGFVGDEAKKSVMATLRAEDQKLTEIQQRRHVPDTIKERAETQSEKLKSLLTEVKEAKPNIDGALEGTVFSKKDKELIRKVLEAVHELYEKSSNQDDLISRVIQKLKRTNR